MTIKTQTGRKGLSSVGTINLDPILAVSLSQAESARDKKISYGSGAPMRICMNAVSPAPTGASPRPELELRGHWSNPDLTLDDHNSIQRNFTREAKLYPDGKGRPYMGEISPITLHEGGQSDIDAACAAMKAR